MTTAKVTLTVDSADISGRLFTRGSARFLPSFARLGDPADQLTLEQAAARVAFDGRGAPAVQLFPCDLIGPQGDSGPAWAYTMYYDGTPGNPQPWSFQLLSTDGGTQRLSSLAVAPTAQTWATLMPWPAGTPSPGSVPVIGSDGVLRWSSAVILDTTWEQ